MILQNSISLLKEFIFLKKEKEFSNNYFVNNELNGPDGTHMVTWLHGCVKLVVRK